MQRKKVDISQTKRENEGGEFTGQLSERG